MKLQNVTNDASRVLHLTIRRASAGSRILLRGFMDLGDRPRAHALPFLPPRVARRPSSRPPPTASGPFLKPGIVRRLVDALPSGAYLVLTHVLTMQPPASTRVPRPARPRPARRCRIPRRRTEGPGPAGHRFSFMGPTPSGCGAGVCVGGPPRPHRHLRVSAVGGVHRSPHIHVSPNNTRTGHKHLGLMLPISGWSVWAGLSFLSRKTPLSVDRLRPSCRLS
jgi:hypothetical protein